MLLVIPMTLVGCSGKDLSTVTVTEKPDGTKVTQTTNVNNSDTAAYHASNAKQMESESNRISNMTEDVMKPSGTQDPEARAWENAFKSVMIAFGDNFSPAKPTGEAPETWINVASKAIDPIARVVTGGIYAGAAVSFADKMMDRDAGTTVNMGDGGTVDGSFNTETHESKASTLNGDANIDNSSISEVSEDDELIFEEEEELEVGGRCQDESSCGPGTTCDLHPGETEGTCVAIED